MKKIKLTLCCFIILTSVNAQSPICQWVKSTGSRSTLPTKAGITGGSIALDASGNSYTTGTFSGTVDFDPGPGIANLVANDPDIFITKLNPAGNFVWAKSIAGIGDGVAMSIVVDHLNNVFTTGYFTGTADFDPGIGVTNLVSNFMNIFISKLDSAGNFIWAKNMGGAGESFTVGRGITVDASNNVYTTGAFRGTIDFDPGIEVNNLTSHAYDDLFISKLNAEGNHVWTIVLGEPGGEAGSAIATDASNNLYITGNFQETVDFDPGSGTSNLTAGLGDVFVLKLDSSGKFLFARNMGGGNSIVPSEAIAIDKSGNIYTTGGFFGTADFDPGIGVFNLSASNGSANIFISKLNAVGNFEWAIGIGDYNYSDIGTSIALDGLGNVHVTSRYALDSDSAQLYSYKLDPQGNFVWTLNISGKLGCIGTGIVVDKWDNIYTTGFFSGIVHSTSLTCGNFTAIGERDMFVQKISRTTSKINEYTTTINNIIVYPNPTTGLATISVPNPINTTIEIYNSLGSLIDKQLVLSPLNSIALTNQPNGLYFIKVLVNNEIITLHKLVKQ